MTGPKPTYITVDTPTSATCPACGGAITIGNAGGYRTYCESCCVYGDDWTLIADNCLNVTANMADNSCDLTVTSPPYDNLRDYGKDFDADSFDWHPIIKELYRVTAVGGVVVWVVADATINGSETGTSFKQALWAMECGFRLHDTMIWDKGSANHPDSTRYYNVFEYMFVFSKESPKTVNLIKDKKNKRAGTKPSTTERRKDGTTIKSWASKNNIRVKDKGVRGSIWRIPGEKRNKERALHAAVMSEALASDHIISWSDPGDLVFDPFLGSGTTGKMAIRNGRKFIGCDIESSYVDIAHQRIANAAGDYVTTEKEKKSGQIALWDMV